MNNQKLGLYQEALKLHNEEVESIMAKSVEFDQKFTENQEKDGSFLNELRDQGFPVKIYTDFHDSAAGVDTYKENINTPNSLCESPTSNSKGKGCIIPIFSIKLTFNKTYLGWDEKFELVHSVADAQVVVSPIDFKKITEEVKLDPETQICNQFPYESVLVIKNCLNDCLEKVYGRCQYFQETYYSWTHLPAFIGRFMERDEKDQDNTWICKPLNNARSSGHIISNNLD